METSYTAGRVLDALVAEHVMDLAHFCGRQPSGARYDVVCPVCDQAPPYSTSIAAAWEIVENYPVVTVYKQGAQYLCTISRTVLKDDFLGRAVADTAPFAICLAALRAKQVT